MNYKKDLVRILIEISPTVEEANEVIDHFFGFETIKEKIAFLKGMFDVKCIDHDEKDEATYYAMLNAIINS